MISYRSNFAGLPKPAAAQKLEPVAGHKRGFKWSDEDLACFEALLEQGLTPTAAARRMGRVGGGSGSWALEKLRRRSARQGAPERE